MARVRQAIRDGTIWELAERRSTGHPALAAGMRVAIRGTRVFLPTEPESRRAFRTTVATSGLRPAVIRFLARLDAFKAGPGALPDAPVRAAHDVRRSGSFPPRLGTGSHSTGR